MGSPRSPLTPEEKARRQQNYWCLYCLVLNIYWLLAIYNPNHLALPFLLIDIFPSVLNLFILSFLFPVTCFCLIFGVNGRKHISNLLSSTLKHSHFPFSLVFSFPHFLACSLLLSTSFYLVTLIVWLYCWLGARSRTPVSNLSFSFSILSRSFGAPIHSLLLKEGVMLWISI